MRRSKYGPTLLQELRERLDWWAEQAWHCWIRRRHQPKMDSHGCCYRCGKPLTQAAKYAAQMRAGKWRAAPDLTIEVDQPLRDGQQRLRFLSDGRDEPWKS